MGKAIPRLVKLRAKELLEKHPESFSPDFEKNKKSIRELGLTFSKLETNLIAGYIARLLGGSSEPGA